MMRILIVDDDSSVRDVLGLQFERRGHTVAIADTAYAATGVLTRTPEPFDVIVADHDVGSTMTGVAFYRLLKPGAYRDKFVFFTTEIEGLPKRVPVVEKPNFQELIATVEGLQTNG